MISVNSVFVSPGGSEHAQRQLFRALRYHTLQDPQLHNTLKDLLASVRAPGKGLSAAARIYLARRESTWWWGGAAWRLCKYDVMLNVQLMSTVCVKQHPDR